MPSKFVHAVFTSLVLRICLSYSTGLQIPDNTATVLRQPMKFIKSSLDASDFGTGVSKNEKRENVRTVEDIRSPASIGVNFYRLPPSPANLLKPDGFQFYTYNERGDMITRQMTMQEIQALIAGGGPDHSNIAIQEPQKVEDTLTGGKKVIDVVEKVQSVLKSAMDKPLSTLTGPHPTIPEKANVEWSNILPAILAGDKYGSKVEEHQYVEESTSMKPYGEKSTTESEDNASDIVSPVMLEQIHGTQHAQSNETISQSEKNESHSVPSVVTMSDIASSTFAEKIMIPVRVITTEQVAQHTTQSYNFHQVTEAIPSLNNNRYEHLNYSAEKDSTTTSEATKDNFDSALAPNASVDIVAKETEKDNTNATVADVSIGKVDVPLKAHTSPLSVWNQVQSSPSKESYSSGPSSQYTTSTFNRSTTLPLDSSTIAYDTVTKVSDFVETTENVKPFSADLVNSLSSVISQVSDDVSSVLTDTGLESTVSDSRTTWPPAVMHKDEDTTVGNDMFGENVFAETTSKLVVDGETISSVPLESITLPSTPMVDKITNYSASLTEPATSHIVSDIADGTSSNGSLGIGMTTTPIPFNSSEINNSAVNNMNSSKPVAMVDSILRTVSTEASFTPASESITIPHTLPSGYLANTFASALIAGFDNQNLVKSQTAAENATMSLESQTLTSTTLDYKLSNSREDATSLETTIELALGPTETSTHSLLIGSSPPSDSQTTDEESKKSDNAIATHFKENTTEIWTTERSDQDLMVNKSERISATANLIESGELDRHHHVTVESSNSTVTAAEEFAPTYSDGAVPATNASKMSQADKNVTSVDSIYLNKSENKTDILGEVNKSQLLDSKLESEAKEKLEDRDEFTVQKKANDTSITSSYHVWQRVSLHQTTATLSTKVDTTTKQPDIPVSTMATTMLETNTIKMGASHSSSDRESAVSLDATKGSGGLDTTTGKASNDIVNFSRLCNELAIKFWIAANKGLSTGRSLALSPFGMISLLAMIFLGARGSTSDQMNEILGLDNVATFNPHLIFQNVTDTVSLARHQGIANAAFVRELFADKVKVRKLLPFYKEQVQQFYEGLVAEVNFATISDLVRRRTNLLVRKQTGGRIKDFVKSNAVPLRSPLAAISANVFETDCNSSSASATGRDGELYFAVSSAHRLRKLIPVPATVWRSNVLAGYEPSLDATAIAIGGIDKLVSTIFLLPGQQGHIAPGDTLDRLEQQFVRGAFRDGSWYKVLKVLIPRPGLELQLPKFSHRSVVNATAALKRMGLDQLFSKQADFKGINGIGNRLFLSDVLQMNLFGTCGDENIANGRHHVEVYPASPSLRNYEEDEQVDWKSDRVMTKEGRMKVERSGEKPRLKLDQPFLYFVRHNPTGLILHMGRFNPRLI